MLNLVKVHWRMGVLVFLCGVIGTGCARFSPHAPGKTIRLSEDVTVQRIKPAVWLYTASYDLPEYGRVPANGLILIGKNDALMVNTPWTEPQTALLFDWIEKRGRVSVKTVVLTHSHQDCAGGLAEAHRRKAESWALDRTADLLKADGKPAPTHVFPGKTEIRCGSETVELFYPGPGHTVDNISAWLPESKVLFAGCLIKSLDAKNLGNTKDGDLEKYPETLKKMKQVYPDAVLVVPGHGAVGGLELLDHTLDLCKKTN